jgi:hypothetical protein
VTVYQSSAQAEEVFVALFNVLVEDGTFVDRMRAGGLSLHLIQTHPDVELHVDAEGVHTGPPAAPSAITMRMRSDTAHAMWMGNLLMPLAVATGRVRIRGSVSKVLEMVPLLQPAMDRYPALATAAGIPV